ncbi:MAG: GNAT family N-acetyltransferase [Phycisphaera sp.]|nr:GNAT family N-acetyltransferase [Phycisphaera sp.]
MSEGSPAIPSERVHVRSYLLADQPRVRALYEHGRLAGEIAANDTGADMDMIHEAYLQFERAHFWVAEVDGEVVGMIGVAEDEPNRAEVRRLRVDKRFHDAGQAIAVKLLETALEFCRHHGYLKVVLDTHLDPGAAVGLFDRFGFQHNRTRNLAGKELLDFYLDLYRDPHRDDAE